MTLRGWFWLALALTLCVTSAVAVSMPDPALALGRDHSFGNSYDDAQLADASTTVAAPELAVQPPLALTGVGGYLYDSSGYSVATNKLDEAASAANGVRLNAQLAAEEIAGGHAFTKHIVEMGEFPGIRTRAQFAEMIESVVTDYSGIRHLSGGRTAYWRDGVVVIRNPSAVDGGTAFVPRDGYEYFEGLN